MFLFAAALQSSFALEITSPEYAGGAKNRPFNYRITSSPSTFSYGATNLPNGLSLHPIGEISGTPLETGVYSATIKATRSGTTVSKLLTIEINDGRPGDFDLSFGVAAATGSSSQISVMARQPDGKLIIGGAFAQYAGVDRTGIARLNVDGSLDLGFNPVLTDAGSPGSVGVIAVQEDGEMMVIAGNFTEVNGAPRNHFARLESDGSLDPTFNPTAGTDGGINAFALQSDGKLIVGGAFGSINGQSRNGLARLQTDGMLDTTFQPNPAGYVNVYSLAIQPDHKVIVAGETDYFSGIPGTVLEKGITRLNEDGSLDGSFNPGLGLDGVVLCLALQRDGKVLAAGLVNTFNGAPKLGLLRLKTDGSLDQNYIPDFSGFEFVYIYALALQPDGKAIIGGSGETFSQQSYRIFRRLTANGTDDSNTFSPSLSSDDSVSVLSLAPDGAITAGGNFAQAGFRPAGTIVRFHGGPVVLHSPTIAVDSPNGTFAATPDVQDTGAVTHFRIVDLTGATVFLPGNPSIPLKVGDFITAAQAAPPGSLSYLVTPGVSVSTIQLAAATGPSPSETGLATSTVSFLPQSGPVQFRLETDYPIAHEHDGQMICRVLKTGGSPGTATTWTAALTLDADNNGSATAGLDYENPPEALRTLVFNSHDVAKSLVIPVIAGDFDDGALLEEFDIVLTTPPGGGATIVEADTYNPVVGLGVARAFIVDSDAVSLALPVDPPPGLTLPLTGDGVLTVNFDPADIGGGWRVFPESTWRASGTTAIGLERRQHLVEFKPVPGYATPETTRVEAFAVADAGNVPLLALYRPQATGSLLANITTEGAPGSGQWRRRGETTWRNGGTMETGLAPGRYVVEFRPAAGLVTPPARAVDISSSATATTDAHYRAALAFPGTPARPTALAQVEADPYWFVGQVRTEGGTATGTVVGGGHVVLTAAHALFDEVNLRFWTRVEWLFQRHGSTEPAPRVPRGMHIFGRGYSRQYETQRRLEGTPGVASLDSDDLDVAALIFYEPAGRFDEINDLKGSAGVVSANGADNPWFIDQPGTPRDRMLVGYPVENELGEIAPANADKMHATTLAPHTFTAVSPRVFRSTALQGFRGMDGAPVFVRDDNALLSVAGIYLGGNGETRVRAIDAGIVQLIAQAQFWGENQVDGTGDNFQPVAVRSDNIQAGYLQVQMNQADGRWRLQGASIYQSPAVKVRLTSAAQIVEFKPVANYVTPLPFATPVGATEGFFVEVIYLPINSYGRWRAENFPGEMDLPLTSGQDADPDFDGLKNSLEYAFNLAPKEAGHPVFAEGGDPTGLPSVTITGTPPNARLTVEFVRRRGTVGLTYAPEFAGNLAGPWVGGIEVSAEIIDDFWEKVRVEDVATTTGATRRFVRVSVTATQ